MCVLLIPKNKKRPLILMWIEVSKCLGFENAMGRIYFP
jgi:hypothetical protein